MKIHIDASRIPSKRPTLLGYSMKDNQARILITKCKKLGYCNIIVAECLAVRETILDDLEESPKDYH